MYIPKRAAGRSPFVLAIALLVAGLLIAAGVIAFRVDATSGNAGTSDTGARTTKTISSQDVTAAQAVTTQYMHAFLARQYHTMWSLLHPQVQAVWPDEAAFTTYWSTRFQEYTLHTFMVGQAKTLSSWTNPETMTTYANVLQLPVSLQLDFKAQQTNSTPPEDLHPSQLFKNLPFVVQHIDHKGSIAAHWAVLEGGPADLEAPILPPTTPVASTVNVPILMYHHISDIPRYNALDKSLTVSTTVFTQQLDHLKAQGYQTITFNQLFDALYYNGPLPTKPIILTFDDGYDDAYASAYPALVKHGFSGMFYIITGKVNWQGQMSWGQMNTMLTNGMQMGSHTINHVDVGQVYLNSREQVQQELQASLAAMQQHLGVVIQQFCYPSGEPFRHGSLALRRAIVALLAADGYVGATTDPGMTGVEQNSIYPFTLLRLRIDGRDTVQNFINRLP